MRTVAVDNETFLIEPGQLAPKMVCLSHFSGSTGGVIHRRDPLCLHTIHQILHNQNIILVGQNIPYDLAVWANEWPELLPAIFQAYKDDRICDTMTRQKLIDIAKGEYRGFRNALTNVWTEHKYHLADLAKRHEYELDLDKDTWRLRYSELYDVDVKDWPQDAIDYSYHDARSTYHVWEAQEADAQYLDDQSRQARAHWALHLSAAWGVRTDGVMVERLERLTQAKLDGYEKLLFKHKLLERKKDGTITKKVKKAKEYAAKAWGDRTDCVLTDTGQISLSEDAAIRLDDEIITAFQQFSSASTVMSRIEELKMGVDMPIHTRYDELMEAGRTSSSKPNTQARKAQPIEWEGEKAGDRECFVPRRDNVFYVTDVPGLELRTIGQKCKIIVGYSKLIDMLNDGIDPHAAVGSDILGVSYDEMIRRKKDPNDEEAYLARQTGKIVNFGLDARLGWKGLISQARTKYKIILDESQAKEAIEAYYRTLPEMKDFHKWVDNLCGRAGVATISHLFSNRYRGFCPPTVLSNTFSQGLGADATKSALFGLADKFYNEPESLLYGCRQVLYGHDEYVTEGPEDDKITPRAEEYRAVICDHINEWLPDVSIKREDYEVVVCRRWSKLAKAEYNERGELKVWEWDEAVRAGSAGFAR